MPSKCFNSYKNSKVENKNNYLKQNRFKVIHD